MLMREVGVRGVRGWEESGGGGTGPDEIRVKQTAAGLNFSDIYRRSGARPIPLPNGMGLEGAGTVTAVGEGVNDLAVGDRIGYADMPLGAYAEERVMPVRIAVKLPDAIARSEEHKSELQTIMRSSYAVFCLNKNTHHTLHYTTQNHIPQLIR